VLLGNVRKRAIGNIGSSHTFTVKYADGSHYDGPLRTIIDEWVAFQGSQVTDSENHSYWRSGLIREAKDVYLRIEDTGGDFTSEKKYLASPVNPVIQNVSSGVIIPGGYTVTYKGAVRPTGLGGLVNFPASARSSDAQLAAFGTHAIAQCAPTNSVANLSTALLELYHDGLPKLMGAAMWKRRAESIRGVAKSSGEEYLNLQFGWKPLVGDVEDVAKGVLQIEKLVKQYYRDADRVVRRRYSFPPVMKQEEVTVFSKCDALLVGGDDSTVRLPTSNQGVVVRRRLTTINRWFSGAFTYHIPDYVGEWMLSASDKARKILGLEITPEVLWELVPWSWAIDWFANVGDLIQNVHNLSSDGLVMRYGYIMEHSMVRDTYIHIGPTGFKDRKVFCEPYTFVVETKLRRRATPFGFGLDLSALTSQQKSILAALGLSRIR